MSSYPIPLLGAFRDREVARVLDIGREIKPLYIMPIGKPA